MSRKKHPNQEPLALEVKQALLYQFKTGKIVECWKCHNLVGRLNYPEHCCPNLPDRPRVGATSRSDIYNQRKNLCQPAATT